jgi:hypothetical protein
MEFAMQISIVDRGDVLSDENRAFGERRLLFALSRFSSRIERVTAVISDVNGPRSGRDKSCRVSIKMRKLPDVDVTVVESDVECGFSQVADRAGRTVARAIERERQFRGCRSVAS